MRKSKPNILIVIMLVLVFALSACSSNSEEETGSDSGGATSSQAASDNSADADTEDQDATVNQDIRVETSCGDLYYPYGFEEIVKYEKEDSDGIESYVFYAVLAESEIKVYTISFSAEVNSELGNLLGTIENSSVDTLNVYFLPEEEIVNDDMSEDEQNTVYAAQETVNDVIDSLNNLSTFVNVAE